MKKEDVNVCIMRVGGTNCDAETKSAFEDSGVKAEIVHLNKIIKEKSLLSYDALVFPGGFAYGDYVRAGAIWAKGILAKLERDLKEFIAQEKLVLGICNGFQVLVEAGLLPGFDGGSSKYSQAALATNEPIGYRCMWVHLKHVNSGRCLFTQKIPRDKMIRIPIAHAEGRFMFPKEEEEKCLRRLIENDQLVFRYCNEKGEYANGKYPANPNGAFYDIAGICNPEGTIFGLMPHPERAYYGWQLPDWTRRKYVQKYGDGRLIIDSMTEYLTKKF